MPILGLYVLTTGRVLSWEIGIQTEDFNDYDLGKWSAGISFPLGPKRSREEPWSHGGGCFQSYPWSLSCLCLGTTMKSPAICMRRQGITQMPQEQASQTLKIGWLYCFLPFIYALYNWRLFCLFSFLVFPLSSLPLLSSSLPPSPPFLSSPS